jgi:plasmid segregation protein ParM
LYVLGDFELSVLAELGCDVGYFGVKLAYRDERALATTSFPSVATRVDPLQMQLAENFLGNSTRGIDVDVDGETYRVDTGTNAIPGSRVVRSETDDFPRTRPYAALVLASLSVTRARRINCLVLGLPLHTIERHSKYLRERFTREHRLDGGRLCAVEKVVVLPQPWGARAYLRSLGLKAASADMSMCIIDSGWHTCDAVVVGANGAADMSRSIGRPGGAAIVIREVARLLSQHTGHRVENLDRIDLAIRTHQSLVLRGRQIDLQPFLHQALHVTRSIADAVATQIGSSEDLEIFGTGGAAPYYREAFTQALGCTIRSVERAEFCNAIGFLLAAERARGSVST